MRSMSPLARITAGFLLVVLFSAVGYGGTRIAMGALDEHHIFSVSFGETGQGLVSGSDIKVRGVVVGTVGAIELDEDLNAIAELKIEPRYEIPERSTFVITNKTLLGEKQVEIRFDGPIDDGPFIAAGDLIDDPDQIVEFENVLGTLSDLMEAIDEEDLIVVVDDFLGAFDGQGEQIARSVDEGARAAATFSRSLDDQVANNRDLSLVAEELSDQGQTFNRLGRATVQGMPTLTENQAEIRELLDELSVFARRLDTTFSVNRADLDRMIINGDNVIRLLGRYDVELGQVMSGLVSYTSGFGKGFQAEGVTGQAAYFQALLRDTFMEELCILPEPLRSEIPACAEEGGGGGGEEPGGEEPGLPDELPDLPDEIPDPPSVPLPNELVEPEVPQRYGLDAMLERSLTAGGGLDG